MESWEAPVQVVVPGVRPGSVTAGRENGDRKHADREASHHRLRLRDLALVLLLGALAPVAGLGLLYLLRNAGVAAIGPKPAGALPLQQLDGSDAQPLVRMALAWLPVGIAVGAATAAFTRMPRKAALVVVVLVAAALLVVSGGVSDSIANNDPLTMHLASPLGVAGTWVSLVLLVIGAAIGERLAVAAPRAPSAA